jgi:hypothetical protein
VGGGGDNAARRVSHGDAMTDIGFYLLTVPDVIFARFDV